MAWQTRDVIDGSSLFETYKEKYGLDSDYQTDQKIFWSHPEVQVSLNKALSWLSLRPNDRILDIGVNNGYDIKILETRIPEELLKSLEFIGFDLAGDALEEACRIYLPKYKNYRFVKGNIADFRGTDVCRNEVVGIEQGSIDSVVALASLQSTSLLDIFEQFVNDLINKLASNSQLFVGLPNFHIDSKHDVVLGLFDAKKQTVDYSKCEKLSEKLESTMANAGFKCQKTGEIIVFYHFVRL
jgi:trans-aconitate methyltransferase